MTSHASSPRYWAYLLRCWQEPGVAATGSPTWRFSLEDPHTDERHGFASFDTLVTFLHNKLCDDPCTRDATTAADAADALPAAPRTAAGPQPPLSITVEVLI